MGLKPQGTPVPSRLSQGENSSFALDQPAPLSVTGATAIPFSDLPATSARDGDLAAKKIRSFRARPISTNRRQALVPVSVGLGDAIHI